jgi:hypothetical protein
MRIRWVVLRGVLAACTLTACFDEGGEEHQTAAALTTADGVLAFADLINNINVDNAAAGVALGNFVKTPIAARDLVSPPFQLQSGTTIERTVLTVPAELPGCISTSGPTGCDMFTTSPSCEAGTFSFTGTATRMCSGCPDMADVLGTCTYSWQMGVAFSDERIGSLVETTKGTVTTTASSITANLEFGPFSITGSNGLSSVGFIKVCSCGAATVEDLPPRRLVNSSFVIHSFNDPGNISRLPDGCALVEFDGNGTPTAQLKCSCADDTTCRP